MFLYGPMSIPLNRSKRFTLPPPDRPVRSENDFSGKHSSQAASRAKTTYLLTFPQPSKARHSFIQPIELGRRGENDNDQASKR